MALCRRPCDGLEGRRAGPPSAAEAAEQFARLVAGVRSLQ